MKLLSILVVANLLVTTQVFAQSRFDEEMDSDESVYTPEEEAWFYKNFEFSIDKGFRFSQTSWHECTDEITGNYYRYNCVSSRGISQILFSFMNNYMVQCVNRGLEAQGGGEVADLHIVHDGILGDRNHSPRSLHAENRAIDIKSFEMQLTSGAVKSFVFDHASDRPFFRAFRDCWGRVVHTYNGCPYYKGTPGLTGSIGWEDSRHQHHMHTSVPYCVNGQYGSGYFMK